MRDACQVVFGASGLDRAAHLRRDGDLLAASLARGAGVLPVWRGKPLLSGAPGEAAPGLAFRDIAHPVLAEAAEAPVFLGVAADGAHLFAADVSSWVPDDVDEAQVGAFLDASVQRHPAEALDGAGFVELRSVMAALSPRDAELAATARGLLQWHATHRFCARCGAATAPSEGGWQRRCAACGAGHFPRTDPVVIMLITHGDSVLVGRSPAWPERMYSLLAGFVEPGETIEAAVRREVLEEAGVTVGPVRYLASQPWPFPASLMLGCHGEAETTEITVDPAELQDARWVSRSEMLEVFMGRHPEIAGARKGAIAHFLMQAWLADRIDHDGALPPVGEARE
ncbi:NAD(+) diphosphatase [Roseibacterium sp. SDUM158017]|uniref:NAD(+) diphosphatase n=1 Tax=Roseicyclus salinarum TaxID=3036773 RepID=UPI002414D1BC|nr:NAD(+) diphosphatase [Roseibacterium sp. SDUM158017]MDG4647113.1 NAD(+) diphosphatase [Roseibacterium sp. SDUM158017]